MGKVSTRAPLGFYKRNRKWYVRTDPVTGRALSTGCTDLEAARAWRRERERQAVDPVHATATETGVEFWALRLIEAKRRHRSAGTVHYYTKKLGHVIRLFGADTPVSMLTPSRWDDYTTTRRAEGASNHTIVKEIKAAQLVAKLAARAGAFRGDPKLFKPPDLDADARARDRFLTPEELGRLLAALSPKRAAWVAANVAFGARFSEVLRAQPEDVDTSQWLVTVRGTKTKRSRATVPIAEPFRALALSALPFLPLEPWTNMVRDLAAACKRAGIERVTSNDLRRTHSTWLEELGVPHSTIASVLRHSSEKMVREVYGRARPEKLGQAIQALIDRTKTLQTAGEVQRSDSENPKIVQVAQSVEQWTEKPTAVADESAGTWEKTLKRGSRRPRSSATDAVCDRPVADRNVTIAPPRALVRDVTKRLRRRAEFEEAVLDVRRRR